MTKHRQSTNDLSGESGGNTPPPNSSPEARYATPEERHHAVYGLDQQTQLRLMLFANKVVKQTGLAGKAKQYQEAINSGLLQLHPNLTTLEPTATHHYATNNPDSPTPTLFVTPVYDMVIDRILDPDNAQGWNKNYPIDIWIVTKIKDRVHKLQSTIKSCETSDKDGHGVPQAVALHDHEGFVDSDPTPRADSDWVDELMTAL